MENKTKTNIKERKMIEEREVIGLDEEIMIYHDKNKKSKVLARIDTGATKSSIDTGLAGELRLGPVVNTKVVRSAHGSTVRPMINVNLELANNKLEAEFSLADRSHMKYKVLIGQNILKAGKFLIDPLKE